MERIETREYALTKSKYFEILVKMTFKRRVFIIVAIVVAFALLNLFWPGGSMQRVSIVEIFIFLIILPTFYVFACWRAVNNPMNQRILLPKTMVFDEAFMDFFMTNGENSKLKTDSILKARITADCYLLYTSNIIAIIVPFVAFKTEADRSNFENIFRRRNVLK